MAMAALPCAGHGSLYFPGMTLGNVVVVVLVVVDDDGVVVVVGDAAVVVVVEVVVVDDRAISGVTKIIDATSRPLEERAISVPRRKSGRRDDFTHPPYFATRPTLVTAL
jgi:hypothetical protein